MRNYFIANQTENYHHLPNLTLEIAFAISIKHCLSVSVIVVILMLCLLLHHSCFFYIYYMAVTWFYHWNCYLLAVIISLDNDAIIIGLGRLDSSIDANDLHHCINSFIVFSLAHLFVAAFHHLLFDFVDLFVFGFAAPVFILFKIATELCFFSFEVIYFLAFDSLMCLVRLNLF